MTTLDIGKIPVKYQKAAATAVVIGALFAIVAVLRGISSNVVAPTLPVEQSIPTQQAAIPTFPSQPTIAVMTPEPIAPEQQVIMPVGDEVELIMLHDLRNPASTFTTTVSLGFANDAAIGMASEVPGCYLINFGETQAWSCDARLQPTSPLQDFTPPQPTAVPYIPVQQPQYVPQPQQMPAVVEPQPAELQAEPTAVPPPPPTEVPRDTIGPAKTSTVPTPVPNPNSAPREDTHPGNDNGHGSTGRP